MSQIRLMDSTLLAKIHMASVLLFLITYLIKTVLLFTSKPALEKYSRITKVPEMIISTLFLVTGLWLFFILGGIKMFHIIKLIFVFIAIPLAVVGFKKQKKGLALVSLILIIGAYGLGEVSKKKPFIPAKVEVMGVVDTPKARGNALYLANCVFCHGDNGGKMYRGAPDLRSISSVVDVEGMIRGGTSNKMPSYGGTLTQEEISDISLYVLSMRNSTP